MRLAQNGLHTFSIPAKYYHIIYRSHAKKSEQSYKPRLDPSGKSTKDKVKFTFNSGNEIQVNCSNWEENLRMKNNWSEGLSVIISTKEVIDWLKSN